MLEYAAILLYLQIIEFAGYFLFKKESDEYMELFNAEWELIKSNNKTYTGKTRRMLCFVWRSNLPVALKLVRCTTILLLVLPVSLLFDLIARR